MVDAYEKKLGRAKLQKLPCGQEILRSLVACGVYLVWERVDISFTVKDLAGKMAYPVFEDCPRSIQSVGSRRGRPWIDCKEGGLRMAA